MLVLVSSYVNLFQGRNNNFFLKRTPFLSHEFNVRSIVLKIRTDDNSSLRICLFCKCIIRICSILLHIFLPCSQLTPFCWAAQSRISALTLSQEICARLWLEIKFINNQRLFFRHQKIPFLEYPKK